MVSPRLAFRAAVLASGDCLKKLERARPAGLPQSARSRTNPGTTLHSLWNGDRAVHSSAGKNQPKEEQKTVISSMNGTSRIQEFKRLLTTAVEGEDCNLCLETFKSLLLSSSPPDSSSFALLEKSLRNAANPSQILRFAQEVVEITVEREPTVINRILFILGKIGHLNTALMIFEGMKNSSRKMDSVTFNTVLSILGKHGEIDRMISEFESMKDLGYVPDYITYNTLINSLRRFGKVNLCSNYLKEMVDREIKPDLQTYTAVMDNLGRAGHVGDAVRVLGEMKNMQIRPSVYVFRGLVGNLRKVGKLEMAGVLQEEMKSSRLLGPKEIEEEKQFRKKRFSFRDWRLR